MSGSFFHKGITRFQAELCLTNAKEDGSFLVRDSESLVGAYVLCLLHQSKVHQYRVLPAADRKLHVQSETGTIQRGYGDLTELIAEYIKKGDQNGLACALIHPVPPDGSVDDFDMSDNSDEDDFENPPPVMSPPAVPPHRQLSSTQTDPNKVDLHKNLAKLDLTGCDKVFCQALKDYADTGSQRDMVAMNVGESELPEFTKVLEIASLGLKKELDVFMKKMDILNDLLKVGESRQQSSDTRKKLTGPVIPSMLEQLSRVRSDILNVQTKAQETLQLASISSEYEVVEQVTSDVFTEGDQMPKSGPFLSSQYRHYIPQSKFEVKKIKHNRVAKALTLTVDLQNGRYSILKQTSRETLDQTTISHEKILHLIKSTKDKCHLDMVLEGKKKQTYAFADHHMRENFCLQIRQMKNMHSTEAEIEQISLFIGTWNMGDTSPNQSLSTWLKCTGAGKSRDRVLGMIPHDMYVIGTQESSMTEKDWVNTVKAGLKACVLVDMELLEVCTLWGIRLVILVKPEHKNCISRVQRSSVRTGIANALGNKGAVAISFFFNGTSFCFVNSHLTSGDERCNKRNQNYRDIIKGLTMSLGQKHLNNFDITNEFQHVFFLGDLNYRVEEKIQVILTKTVEKDLSSLIEKDQLKMSQRNKTAFCGFQEADITFLPTYRLERNMTGYKYAWKKVKRTGERINAPSWCDRVLWRSYPGLFIENVAYGSSETILSSDHRPVFSSFNVGISSEFVQSRGSLAEMAPVKIIFHSIEAQVKTCCKQYFQVVFYSSCLQEIYKSEANTQFQDNRTGFYTVPCWNSPQLPEMKPLFGDQDFLEDQHILIAVISRDDSESYGECVLSLKEMVSSHPKEFEYILLHQGEETGKIKGKMHVTSKASARSSSKKSSYSLIAFDTEYHDPEVFLPDKPKINRGNASFVKPQSSGFKPPLRNALSAYTNNSSEYEAVENRIESITPIPPPRKNPVMGQSSLLQGNQRGVVRQTSSPPIQLAPPPVPPKSRSMKGKDTLQKAENPPPKTIDEWLAALNLSCYEQNFSQNRWTSLVELNGLSEQHLINMRIDIPSHRERILASVKELNKKQMLTTEKETVYSTETDVHPHTYAILTPDVILTPDEPEVKVRADSYIEFKLPQDDDSGYDTFRYHDDVSSIDDNPYHTLWPTADRDKHSIGSHHTDEQTEDVFMSLEELRASPIGDNFNQDRIADSKCDPKSKDEDVFGTLDELRASPGEGYINPERRTDSGREAKDMDNDIFVTHADIKPSTGSDTRQSKSKSYHQQQHQEDQQQQQQSGSQLPQRKRHSQPPYYNIVRRNNEETMSLASGKSSTRGKENTSVRHNYYNVHDNTNKQDETNEEEEVFMSLEELNITVDKDHKPFQHMPKLVEPPPGGKEAKISVRRAGLKLYDHTGQQYDHTGQQYDHTGQQYDHKGEHYGRIGYQYDHTGQQYDRTGQHYDHTVQQYDQTSRPTNKLNQSASYDHVVLAAGKTLTTIEDWLRHLGMSHYLHNLLDNGWDSLYFLPEMTVSDLTGIGINDPEDQCIILQSIKSMNN